MSKFKENDKDNVNDHNKVNDKEKGFILSLEKFYVRNKQSLVKNNRPEL